MLKNEEEMKEFAEFVANSFLNNPKNSKGKISKKFQEKVSEGATIIALYGDLGSGKTTFTKYFISAFGIKQIVTSPTFVIEKIYKIPPLSQKPLGGPATKFRHIIHIDAYRLESGKDMEDLGWKEISENPENIILIEWPEKIADILPKDIKKIEFKFVDEDKREVVF